MNGSAVFVPPDAFGLAREIYGRRTYLAEHQCKLPSGGLVVDAGANCGLFAVLAARSGNRVLAIEGQRRFMVAMSTLLDANGLGEAEVEIICARLGQDVVLRDDEYTPRALGPRVELAELLDERGVESIDFLKMDIEGSEFGALTPEVLARTSKVAMEVHPAFGDAAELVNRFEGAGFRWRARTTDLQVADRPPTEPFYLHAWRED